MTKLPKETAIALLDVKGHAPMTVVTGAAAAAARLKRGESLWTAPPDAGGAAVEALKPAKGQGRSLSTPYRIAV